MAAHTGEHARKIGDFRCEPCHERVHVPQVLPHSEMPELGNDTHETREHGPDTEG